MQKLDAKVRIILFSNHCAGIWNFLGNRAIKKNKSKDSLTIENEISPTI
jgi:hypothetical protein